MDHLGLRFGFRSVTPLWTGDKYKKGNSLRPTGLIGSSRFWYWVLKRLDGNSITDADALTNFLFGITSWGKPFRFSMREVKTLSAPKAIFRFGQSAHLWKGVIIIVPNRLCKNPVEKFNQKTGTHLSLKCHDLPRYIHQEWIKLLNFMGRYGFWGIGGQHGLGIVKFFDLPETQLPKIDKNICWSEEFQLTTAIGSRPKISVLPRKTQSISESEASERLSMQSLSTHFERQKGICRDNHKHKLYHQSLNQIHKTKKLLSDGKTPGFLPIAYEIRHWLSHHNKLSKNLKENKTSVFGKEKRAGLLYLSHPFLKQDNRYWVRVTLATRTKNEKNKTDCKAVLDLIKPYLSD